MADEPKRIIDLTEVSSVAAGDYLAMDSEDGGTKKIPASHFTGGSGQVMWGGIQGDITQQEDLNGYLEQLPNKADIDGYYEDMSVGSAEQLLSNMFEDDSDPYLFRSTAGSKEVGDRVYEDAIVGVSMPWNQLISSSTSWTTTHVSMASNANNGFRMTVTDSGALGARTGNFPSGHVLVITADIDLSQAQMSGCFGIKTSDNSWGDSNFVSPNYFSDTYKGKRIYFGKTDSTHTCVGFKLFGDNTAVNDYADFDNMMVHDLTLMFGSTIADYIYSLTTNANRLAYLKSYGFFLKDYYAYNAGQLLSVKTSAHKTVGFNAYDNSTGKAKLLGGKEYQITGAYTALSYSTGETLTPDANGKFTPTDNGELTVTGGNGTTTCVHLVWDGERDGEFEAYEEHTYPLDADLELRGVPKLVDGKIKYDGDLYESDGTIMRKYGIVDLGTLTWVKVEDGIFRTSYTNIDAPHTSTFDMMFSRIYSGTSARDWSGWVSSAPDKSMGWLSTYAYFVAKNTAYTDADTFKTSLSGIYMVFPLATPTTESADPYTNPQWVDNWGTEEFIDTRNVPVPVGHDSRYLPDLKAKLESAPNNPSTNGKYFLQYENGQATYVPVPSEVPQTPSEDGTYVLKATVTSGTATLSWVAEE